MTDLISIIVPVYNTSKYLSKCIDSILAQTYKKIELILVDDGSTDASGTICDEYAEKDNRIVVIHKENAGQAVARNVALDIAKGDYIGFVDSDDYIKPEMFSLLYNALIENNADMSFCGVVNDHIFLKKECPKMNESHIYDTNELFISYIREPFVRGILWNKLYKASLFQDLRFSPIRAREDADLLYKIYGRCNRAVYIPNSLYVQFIRPGSTEQSSFNDSKLYSIKINNNMSNYINTKLPSISNYAELLIAKACGDVLAAIASDNNFKDLISVYNNVIEQLKMELKIHQVHDSVNNELYNRLQDIINNQKKFVFKCKIKKIKNSVLNSIKKALLLLT